MRIEANCSEGFPPRRNDGAIWGEEIISNQLTRAQGEEEPQKGPHDCLCFICTCNTHNTPIVISWPAFNDALPPARAHTNTNSHANKQTNHFICFCEQPDRLSRYLLALARNSLPHDLITRPHSFFLLRWVEGHTIH